MARSVWKGLFFESNLYREERCWRLFEEKVPIKFRCRRSVISSCFLDYVIHLHNGQKFYRIVVKPDMTGMKWGSIVPTHCGGGKGRVGLAQVQARKASYRKGGGKKKKKFK